MQGEGVRHRDSQHILIIISWKDNGVIEAILNHYIFVSWDLMTRNKKEYFGTFWINERNDTTVYEEFLRLGYLYSFIHDLDFIW